MKVLYFMLVSFLLASCNSKKSEMKQLVETWRNKEIIFPDKMKMKIYGRDTLDDLSTHKYKIFNYADTSGCSECMLKFFEWRQLKEEIDSLQLDVGLIYVIFSNHYREVEISQILNKFNVPIFYDSLGYMLQKYNFSTDPRYRTFLLDSNNRVVAIGNPVLNKKVWKLYCERIRS